MNDVAELGVLQFSIVYILLVIVGIIMKKCGVNQLKLLIIGSVRMTVQLIIAGFLLTYIFENPHPLFTVSYLVIMVGFSVWRVFSKNKELNRKFKIIIAVSMATCGIVFVLFFVVIIVGQDMLNAQYVIPISGMVMGNMMTGMTLALKTFRESIKEQRRKISALTSIGVSSPKILIPFVRQALETAILPTLNSMVGMGIVSLPGMMTGQILSGTIPTTAILYQIGIMIIIATVICLSCFVSLYLGSKTLYNKKRQIISI